jgi:hypothetical protein
MSSAQIILALLFRRWPSVKSHKQSGKLSAFGGGQGCQETALLFVQDPHRRDLGGPAGVGRVNEERPPVTGMALACHVSLVLQVVKEGHHIFMAGVPDHATAQLAVFDGGISMSATGASPDTGPADVCRGSSRP